MGSPVSAVVANLVMEELKKKIFESKENWLTHDTETDTWMTPSPSCIEIFETTLGNLAEYFPALGLQMKLKKKADWPL